MSISEHIICIVAGENPDEIMRKYDVNTKMEPYCVYQFDKAEEYKKTRIKIFKEALKQPDITDDLKDLIKLELEILENQSITDFYTTLTENLDVDENTGDAYSTLNYDGKFDRYVKGNYAMPLGIDKDGNGIYSAIKKDIDFSKIHKTDTDEYELAWNLIKENKEPNGDYEKKLYERIKNWGNYFTSFGNKENYLTCSTMFWAHAFTDGNEWVEYDRSSDQCKWVSKYYDRFIKPLPDDTRITVYECMRM